MSAARHALPAGYGDPEFAAVGSLVYREAVRRKIGLVIDDRYFTQSVHP